MNANKYKVISGREGIFIEFEPGVSKLEQEKIVIEYYEKMMNEHTLSDCPTDEGYAMLEEVILQ